MSDTQSATNSTYRVLRRRPVTTAIANKVCLHLFTTLWLLTLKRAEAGSREASAVIVNRSE